MRIENKAYNLNGLLAERTKDINGILDDLFFYIKNDKDIESKLTKSDYLNLEQIQQMIKQTQELIHD
jgi:hypothetical protein